MTYRLSDKRVAKMTRTDKVNMTQGFSVIKCIMSTCDMGTMTAANRAMTKLSTSPHLGFATINSFTDGEIRSWKRSCDITAEDSGVRIDDNHE